LSTENYLSTGSDETATFKTYSITVTTV